MTRAVGVARLVRWLFTFLILSVLLLAMAVSVSTPAEEPANQTSAETTGEPAAKTAKKIYRIGIAPADAETPVASYLDTVNGIDAQCQRVNHLIESVCCPRYQLGCAVEYTCELVDVDRRDVLRADIAQSYAWEMGYPDYPVHHGSVVAAVHKFLGSLRMYSEVFGGLVVAYTRHRIRVDDESTKISKNKINPSDVRFYFMGMILPGESDREGKVMMLNYYAAKEGILLNVSPTLDSSLALGLAEFRSGLFSFDEKVFTGTGSRYLFELGEGGALVPNINGCMALAEREPPHYTSLLKKP